MVYSLNSEGLGLLTSMSGSLAPLDVWRSPTTAYMPKKEEMLDIYDGLLDNSSLKWSLLRSFTIWLLC